MKRSTPNLILIKGSHFVAKIQFDPEFSRTFSRMSYSKVRLLSYVLLILTVVHAQEHSFNNHDVDAKEGAEGGAGEFILKRDDGDGRENVRLRRDDERARYRRQGSHGGHGGGGGGGGHEGITGPVHTFVKTDEHAHFKWGVRHHVGHEYAGRR